MKNFVFFLVILILPLSLSSAGNAMSKFGGIGIDGVPQANGEILVRQLVAGGPADLAGIRVGDVITRIGGKPVRAGNFQKVVKQQLRGRIGTKVQLTVRRPGQIRLLPFVVTRRELIAQDK
jgi:C-terminal processing protease CtpA/Prc